jgi:hypothetical protein
MSKITPVQKITRYSLGTLLVILAFNAFGGGYYGMAGAKDVPGEWLKGSPFSNYFLPGLILFVCVGGSALFAAIMVFRRHELAGKTAMISAMIVLIWIIVQLAIIGYVSWLQPTVVVAAFLILLLAWQLLKYDQR